MRQLACAIAGAILASSFGVAGAATDPAAVLHAYQVATGGAAWQGKAAMKTVGNIKGQGLSGTFTGITDLRAGRSVASGHLGPASFAQGFDGKHPWNQGPNGEVNIEKGGVALPMALTSAYQNANLWWQPDFGGAKVTAAGDKPCGKATCAILDITPKGGMLFAAWFDTATHLLERTVQTVGPETVTTTLSDYRPVDGVVVPFKQVVDSGHGKQYLQTMTTTAVTFLPAQALAVYAPPKSDMQGVSIAGGATSTTFPFQLINNHIYANAWINGHGPLTFIFDTGGQNILVPSTAKALGVKVEGAMPGGGVGNKVSNYGLAKVASLKVGDATFKNQVVGVLDFEPNDVEGIDIKGMVGFTVFKRFVTRIDYGKHEMTLIEPGHFNAKDAGTPIPFVFDGDLPEIQGTFDGIPGKFQIDTGSRAALTLTGPFAKAHDLRAKYPKGVVAVDGWGVGGSATGYITRGKLLTIGSVQIPNVVTSMSLQKKGAFAFPTYQGNIGGKILKHFVVTFDYANHTMYLKPIAATPLTEVGSYDRAGMWINQAKDGIKVMDVTAHGPAAAAGIKTGDLITTVDGKSATALHVYDLRDMLSHDAPGTVVHFGIQRDGATHAVAVTLRDQI